MIEQYQLMTYEQRQMQLESLALEAVDPGKWHFMIYILWSRIGVILRITIYVLRFTYYHLRITIYTFTNYVLRFTYYDLRILIYHLRLTIYTFTFYGLRIMIHGSRVTICVLRLTIYVLLLRFDGSWNNLIVLFIGQEYEP